MTWVDSLGLPWVRWDLGRIHHVCIPAFILTVQREPLRRAWLHLVRWGSEVY